MKKLIIIKYAELNTKKDNKSFFIKTLVKNIETALIDIDKEIVYDTGRMFIYSSDLDAVISKLQKVFGIHEIEIGYELENNSMETIENSLKELIIDKDIDTFKVETKRSDKNYPLKSPEISKKLG